jgi:DNA-directed RNA polymerase sigma subunit (sigma70/sigma32)
MEKEYRFDVKIRNNIILKMIESSGSSSVPEFCRKHDIGYGILNDIINMKKSPMQLNRRGGHLVWRKTVIQVSEALRVIPDDLFTEKQKYVELKANKIAIEASEAEAQFLLNGSLHDVHAIESSKIQEEAVEILYENLKILPPRMKDIIEMRFGLNGKKEHTLDDIAKILLISGCRIGQIEAKALRLLKYHSIKSKDKQRNLGEAFLMLAESEM